MYRHPSSSDDPLPVAPSKNPAPSYVNASTSPPKGCTAVLPTMQVLLTAKNGRTIVARAILDSGADQGIIRAECCKRLKVKPNLTGSTVAGLSENPVETKGSVEIDISTPGGQIVAPNYPMTVVENITGLLPSVPLDPKLKKLLRNYPLADETFDTPEKPDLLLGIDLYAQIVKGGPISLGPSLPALIPTVFGYVVIGKSFNPLSVLLSEPLRPPCPSPSTALLCCNIQKQVEDFWRMEEANLANPETEGKVC